MNRFEEAQTIDHAILAPEISRDDLIAKCKEAIEYEVGTICVNPCNAKLVESLVEGTKTSLCVVCDFPFGQSSTASRVEQIKAILASSNPTDIDIVETMLCCVAVMMTPLLKISSFVVRQPRMCGLEGHLVSRCFD